MTLARIFLPELGEFRSKVEVIASSFMEQQVKIDSMDARLVGFSPTIVITGVKMLDDKGKRELIRFDEARLGLDLFDSISQGKVIPKSFTVSGVNIGIRRRKDGNFEIKGLDLARLEESFNKGDQQESDELAGWLFERSSLSIEKSTIVWRDDSRGGKTMRFRDVNFVLRNNKDRHQLTGSVTLPKNLGRAIETHVDFSGDILKPKGWQGDFYIKGDEVQLVEWGLKPVFSGVTVNRGVTDLRLWGRWQQGGVVDLSGDIASYKLALQTETRAEPFKVNLISAMFDWYRKQNDWHLRVKNFRYMQSTGMWPDTDLAIDYIAGQQQSPSISAYTSFVRLDDVGTIMTESGFLPEDIQKILLGLSPVGDLEDVRLHYKIGSEVHKNVQFHSAFSNLAIKSIYELPGFRGFNGEIWMQGDRGTMRLNSQFAVLDFNDLFRAPLQLDQASADLHWWHEDNNWYLGSQGIVLKNKDIDTTSNLYVMLEENKTSPYVDLQVAIHGGRATNAKKYFPVSIMEKELVSWLDHALGEGDIGKGGVLLRGRLDDFPYRKVKNGKFVAAFHGENMQLDYQQGWPAIDNISMDARFTGAGLQIQGSSATLYQGRLSDIKVSIPDFLSPVLFVDGKYKGTLDDAMRFLVESPIAPESKNFYSKSVFSGATNISLKLRLPLDDEVEERAPLHYSGDVGFVDAGVTMLQNRLKLTNMNGTVSYSPRGIFSELLQARVYDGDVLANIFTEEIQSGEQRVNVSMQGEMDIAQVGKNFRLPGMDYLHGRTNWQGLLDMGLNSNKPDSKNYFRYVSNLAGVRVDLPAPFNKAAHDHMDFNFNVEFSDQPLVHMDYTFADRLLMKLLLEVPEQKDKPAQIKKGVLNFSSVHTDELPEKNVLRIKGALANFYSAHWLEKIAQSEYYNNADLQGGEMLPIELDMDYLHLASDAEKEQEQNKEQEQKPKPETTATNPADVPLISGTVRDFRLGEMKLGRCDIESSRREDGISFDKLLCKTDNTVIVGDGSWTLRNNEPLTNLVLQVETQNVKTFSAELGYASVFEGGKAKLVLQPHWADDPAGFEWDKLDGYAGIHVEKGALSKVDPGAGRLLGFFSIYQLPRKLLLDFSEFKKGFEFNLIRGQANFKKGISHLEELNIIGPIAFIKIQGQTDFVQNKFDQTVTVIPNVSGTLPFFTWILLGPQIALGSLFLDQSVGSTFDESAKKVYHVTGTWDKPVIEEIVVKKPDKSADSPNQAEESDDYDEEE